MPKYYFYLISTAIFALILIVNVPKEEIRRLSIYGIMFGMFDILMLGLGSVLGLYKWINYGPFAFMGVPLFSPITWSIFFILFFYFLPKQKHLDYVFVAAAVGLSTIYINMVEQLGVFHISSTLLGSIKIPYHRIVIPIVSFSFWFSFATWGYYKLNSFIEKSSKTKIH